MTNNNQGNNTLSATTINPNLDLHFKTDRLKQMITYADQFHKAGCFSKDVQNVHQALVKIQAGFEMGYPPMEAMTSLYIVNGNITIWGKATTKRLREHGWKIIWGNCTKEEANVRILKGDEEYEFKATKDELPKSTAYSFAPVDKLKWHAISRLIRFNVPEILGPISYLTEEAEDMEVVPNTTRAIRVNSSDNNDDGNISLNIIEDTEIAPSASNNSETPEKDNEEIKTKDEYTPFEWILVNIEASNSLEDLGGIESNLPPVIRKFSPEERKQIGDELKKKREKLEKEIKNESEATTEQKSEAKTKVESKPDLKPSTESKVEDKEVETTDQKENTSETSNNSNSNQ